MKLVVFILICWLISGCKEEKYVGYRQIGDKYIKVHTLGEEVEIEQKDLVQAFLCIQTLEGDSLHYVPDYPYFFQIQDSKGLDSLLQLFHFGDSLSIILDQKELKDYFHFYHLRKSTKKKAVLNICIKEKYATAEQAELALDSLLELRKEREAGLLAGLLAKTKNIEKIGNIYRKQMLEGSGPAIQQGSEISIHYKGKFINGYVFDDSYERTEALNFVYGKQLQVLDGLNIGLNKMKEGGKLKIYISSQSGFGEGGSLMGIVPPFTPLIYEIEIIKVKN